jgi:hypothetical protein
MASRNSNLLAKANSVDLDQAMKNATSQGQPQSRGTAPGQLIGFFVPKIKSKSFKSNWPQQERRSSCL